MRAGTLTREDSRRAGSPLRAQIKLGFASLLMTRLFFEAAATTTTGDNGN